MKKYRVEIEYFQTFDLEIEALDEDDAEEKAMDKIEFQKDRPDVTVTLIEDLDPKPETVSEEYEEGSVCLDPMIGQISLDEVSS